MISKIILKLFSILLIFLTGLLNSIFDDKPRNDLHSPENKIESVKQINKVPTVANVTTMAGVSTVVRESAVAGVSAVVRGSAVAGVSAVVRGSAVAGVSTSHQNSNAVVDVTDMVVGTALTGFSNGTREPAVVGRTTVVGVSTDHQNSNAVVSVPSFHSKQTSSRLNAGGMKYLLNAVGMPYL